MRKPFRLLTETIEMLMIRSVFIALSALLILPGIASAQSQEVKTYFMKSESGPVVPLRITWLDQEGRGQFEGTMFFPESNLSFKGGNPEDDLLTINFGGKSDSEFRKEVESSGFRWVGKVGDEAWVIVPFGQEIQSSPKPAGTTREYELSGMEADPVPLTIHWENKKLRYSGDSIARRFSGRKGVR